MQMLTTAEAAVLLSERGMRGYRDEPIKADTVKHLCSAGNFPHAYVEKRGPGRGYWLIPLDDIEAFIAGRPKTMKKNNDLITQGMTVAQAYLALGIADEDYITQRRTLSEAMGGDQEFEDWLVNGLVEQTDTIAQIAADWEDERA
jgi:hypothetical protein